ncbi:MAG: phenylalanine--tRNA ligase subunit beta, partial [bacterium]|nr:phenylalanine--tRNA ligase subunit beta [bacterium]
IVNRGDEAIGLAGVMGGASTEISADTRSVLLEAAWWDPMTIARTARRLGLRSEASARFERGTDPDVIPRALDRFAELAAALGATTSPGMMDAAGNRPAPITVRVRPQRVNSILGTGLSTREMTDLLEPIGFACESGGESQEFEVSIPSWRPDSATEIDVVEEVGRIYGYSKIERTVPVTEQAGALTPRQQDRRRIRALLTGMGISEAMPLPFLAPGDLARAGLGGEGITVANPLVAEESIMRTSLRPGLLKAVAYNAARRTTGVSLFEIGRVNPGGGGDLPDEHEHLAVILAGRQAAAATTLWRRLARRLTVARPGVANGPVEGLHPGRSGRVLADGRPVGALGEIDPKMLDAYEIDERVAWLEADLGALLAADRGLAPYRAPSRYPSSDIDLAFTVPDEVSADDVAATIARAGGELLASVVLFDVFRSAHLGEGRRSLAYTLRFEASDRTLSDAEVARFRQSCIEAVTAAHNAILRG